MMKGKYERRFRSDKTILLSRSRGVPKKSRTGLVQNVTELAPLGCLRSFFPRLTRVPSSFGLAAVRFLEQVV